jgi:hypothetical protein
MWHIWRRGDVCRRFWWVNLRGRDHLGDLGVDWRTVLKWIFTELDTALTGFIWLRIRTGGGLL